MDFEVDIIDSSLGSFKFIIVPWSSRPMYYYYYYYSYHKQKSPSISIGLRLTFDIAPLLISGIRASKTPKVSLWKVT